MIEKVDRAIASSGPTKEGGDEETSSERETEGTSEPEIRKLFEQLAKRLQVGAESLADEDLEKLLGFASQRLPEEALTVLRSFTEAAVKSAAAADRVIREAEERASADTRGSEDKGLGPLLDLIGNLTRPTPKPDTEVAEVGKEDKARDLELFATQTLELFERLARAARDGTKRDDVEPSQDS